MAIYYNHNNVTVLINNQSILADSVGFSVDSELARQELLDQKGGFPFSPSGGIKSNVDISYYLAGSDPLKPFLTNDSSVPLEIAGLTLAEGYVTSYTLNVAPHGPVKVSASLTFYQDFVDNFSPVTLPDEERDYLSLADVSLTLAGIDATSKVKSLSYSVSPEIDELYEAGSLTPTEVRHNMKLTSLSIETYNFREGLLYDGKNVSVEFAVGPETYEVVGVLQAKNVNFTIGEKLTSSLKIQSNSYGGAPVLRESSDPSQKSVGDTWIIYGINLTNTTAVYFNNNIKANKITAAASSYGNGNNSKVTITIPRFARSGPIKVITPYGEAARQQAPGEHSIIANIDSLFIP